MSHPFRYYLRVRYGECDAQKVVFNARYADYVDISTTEFVRAIGFGEQLAAGTLDFQLAKLTLEWKASARYDQVLQTTVYARRLGNTSFTIATEFRVAGEAQLVATAETVYVLVNPATLTKIPLPDEFRSALERGAAGIATDHAGYFSDARVETEQTPAEASHAV